MTHRLLALFGMVAFASDAEAQAAFADGPETQTTGGCISSGAGGTITTLRSKVGYVVDPVAEIPRLGEPVLIHAFATNTACEFDNTTVGFELLELPPGARFAPGFAVQCFVSGGIQASLCPSEPQPLKSGGWLIGSHVGLRPGSSFEVQVAVVFDTYTSGQQLRLKTTSDWNPSGVESQQWVYAPYQPTPPSGTRGDDLALLGDTLSDAGTLPIAFSNDNGSFTVTNLPIADFAAWSRTPNVKRLGGDFNGDGRTDYALVGGAGWNTIPIAMSRGDGRFDVTNAGVGAFGAWATTANVTPVTGDFDRDGDTDIALVGGSGWSSIPIASSRRDGSFSILNATIPDFGGWASSPGVRPIAGDFNRDGMTDIALIGGAGWESLPVAFSYGNGSFDVANPSAQAFGSTSDPYFGAPHHYRWNFAADAREANVKVVTGDFNRDGHTDIALVGGAHWWTIKLAMGRNDRGWTYADVPARDFAAWARSPNVKVLTGDFNKDGTTDLALTGVAGWETVPVASSILHSGFHTSFDVKNRSVVMPNVGNFASWASTAGVRAIAGDFNGDGFGDIALTGGAGWASIPVALGVGNGYFAIINSATNRFPRWASDTAATVVVSRAN